MAVTGGSLPYTFFEEREQASDLDELSRMAAIAEQALSDTPEPAFDRLTELAAQIFHAPMALLAVGSERGHVARSRVGLPEDAAGTGLLCATATAPLTVDGDVLVVEDAAAD